MLIAVWGVALQSGCGSSSKSCTCSASETCVSGKCTSTSLLCSLPPPATSLAPAAMQVFALGSKQVGEEVRFDVPAGAASITVVEQVIVAPATANFTDIGSLPNVAAPLNVVDPTGRVWLDQFSSAVDPTLEPLYFGSLSPSVGTVTLPNSTAGLNLAASGLPSGTWKVVVSDLAHVCSLASNCAVGGGSSAGTYDVTALVKTGARGSNPPATQLVDVTFNLMPDLTPPLSAASAGSDQDLRRMVSTLASLLGQAGLTLNTVGWKDVPAAVASPLAAGVHIDDVSACGDLSQLFATAPAGSQINVFLVPGFITSDATAGTTIVGVDGTIPGPATLSPSLQGGVAVSVADLRASRARCGASPAFTCGPLARSPTCCGADVTAYVAAHEIGHFLGLYHTSELEGTSFDPLQDTPTCPCRSCSSDPGQCADAPSPPQTPHTMSVAECTASATCGGGDNLMFWLFDDGAAGAWTLEQQRVMRANPAVY